jgi:hypothetical protein
VCMYEARIKNWRCSHCEHRHLQAI